MGRRMFRLLFIGAVFSMATLAGCAGPCENLANIICDCEEDPVQRQACRNQVTTDVGRIKFEDKDNQYCEQKLKTCDKECVALRRGDRAACGFVRE
jgi:hypothetical protein